MRLSLLVLSVLVMGSSFKSEASDKKSSCGKRGSTSDRIYDCGDKRVGEVYLVRRTRNYETIPNSDKYITVYKETFFNKVTQEFSGENLPCGLKGSIKDRIENCKFQRDTKHEILVSRDKNLNEIYDDGIGLLWNESFIEEMPRAAGEHLCSRLNELGLKTWRLPTYGEFSKSYGIEQSDDLQWTSTKEGRKDYGIIKAPGRYPVVESLSFPASIRCVAETN